MGTHCIPNPDVACAFWLTLRDEPMGLGWLTLHPNEETGAPRGVRTLWESRSNLPRDGAGVMIEFFKINEKEEEERGSEGLTICTHPNKGAEKKNRDGKKEKDEGG